MAAPDWLFDSTALVLDAVLPLFRRQPGPIADTSVHARTRKTIARLLGDTRAAARSSTLAADLTAVVTGYRQAAGDLRLCIAGYERVIVATRAINIIAPPRTESEALQQQHELALCGLIETLALSGIAACVARLDIASHDEANRIRSRLGRMFDIGIARAAERGDVDVLMRLRGTAGALSRDLIERGRPLARMTSYETAVPLPSIVLAHELYQDAARAIQMESDNPAFDHPSFMPMQGVARSS